MNDDGIRRGARRRAALAGALALAWASACATGTGDGAVGPGADADVGSGGGAADGVALDTHGDGAGVDAGGLADGDAGGVLDGDSGGVGDGDSGGVGDSGGDGDSGGAGDGDGDSGGAGDGDGDSGGAGDGDAGGAGDGDSGGVGDGDSGGVGDGDSGGVGDGGGLPAECADPPPLPRPFTFIESIPGSEDFVFDGLGNLVNIPQKTTLLTTAAGSTAVGFPVKFQARGTRYLPGGDLVVASSEIGGVVRFSPEGLEKKLVLDLPNPNGIAVSAGGAIYLSGMGIRRIDSDSGETELLAEYVGDYAGFDGLTFSPDYGTLYFNEEYRPEGSPVFAMSVGPDGAVGEPALVATIPVVGGKVDGMTADACGNLYVVEMVGRIWRVTPDGPVELVAQLPEQPAPGHFTYVAALNFGSGVGGWAKDHLYVMNSEGGVFDVDVGVPGKPEPHLGSN